EARPRARTLRQHDSSYRLASNGRTIIRQRQRHRVGASHARGLRLRTSARDRARVRPRRRHHAHPAHFPVDRGNHLSLHQEARMDVSELSFGKYISLTSQGAAPMIAIPVFPSRVHRHSAIYVRADRGIKTAKDLEGRTVGIPEWAQTAGIYVRG